MMHQIKQERLCHMSSIGLLLLKKLRFVRQAKSNTTGVTQFGLWNEHPLHQSMYTHMHGAPNVMQSQHTLGTLRQPPRLESSCWHRVDTDHACHIKTQPCHCASAEYPHCWFETHMTAYMCEIVRHKQVFIFQVMFMTATRMHSANVPNKMLNSWIGRETCHWNEHVIVYIWKLSNLLQHLPSCLHK